MNDILFSWSGGKDSALALYEILKNDKYKIKFLFTTISAEFERISLHGVRKSLAKKQAESLGIPIKYVVLPKNCDFEMYLDKIRDFWLECKTSGLEQVVFGDIFLEQLKKDRINQLSEFGLSGLFPLWEKDTKELMQSFIDLGFKGIVTCVDSNVMDKSFVGREIDESFLRDLPPNVDPCGENGEFHTFVYDGPIFKKAVKFTKGEIVKRGTSYFCDLI